MIQDFLNDQLVGFSSDVKTLDKKFTEQKHGPIVKVLTSNNLDIRQAFHDLAQNTDFINDTTIIDAVKDVSMLNLTNLKSFDALDEKTLKIKPDLIEFLAKYLIKRRATYLYIYMLFQKKHIELLKIRKMLGDKYDELKNIVLPPGAVPMPILDVKEFLMQLQTAILAQIKNNPDVTNRIAKIFNDVLLQSQATHSIEYVNAFNSIGELINQMSSKTDGYQTLVQDVIPLIAKWNESVL
jgi:hypothetical protein